MKPQFEFNDDTVKVSGIGLVGMGLWQDDLDGVPWIGPDSTEYQPQPADLPADGDQIWIASIGGRTMVAHNLASAVGYMVRLHDQQLADEDSFLLKHTTFINDID